MSIILKDPIAIQLNPVFSSVLTQTLYIHFGFFFSKLGIKYLLNKFVCINEETKVKISDLFSTEKYIKFQILSNTITWPHKYFSHCLKTNEISNVMINRFFISVILSMNLKNYVRLRNVIQTSMMITTIRNYFSNKMSSF